MADRTEKINGVAIEGPKGIWALPRPARHHDVIQVMDGRGVRCTGDHAQGFTTSKGRFVSRWVARQIAFRAGQTRKTPSLESELFSEDIW